MSEDTDALLTITGLAQEAGAHPNTANHYERQGLLKAVRASDGTRLFRRADVVKLKALVAEGVARRHQKLARLKRRPPEVKS